MILPAEARPLLEALAPVFTRPTFLRFLTLFGSAILTTGRRTVANILRTAAPLAQGHVTTYQRVLSSAEWSALRLACQLCRLVLALIPADQAVSHSAASTPSMWSNAASPPPACRIASAAIRSGPPASPPTWRTVARLRRPSRSAPTSRSKPPSFTIAPTIRSRSTRSSGSSFDRYFPLRTRNNMKLIH